MVVDSGNVEFGCELTYSMVLAWDLFKRGRLNGTISNRGSEPFYYFSPYHFERDQPRDDNHGHRPHVADYKKGECPNWKSHYKNRDFVFDKPLYVICNKYNLEWGDNPVNFLPLDVLLRLVDKLTNYQIIYDRQLPAALWDDNTDYLDLCEHEVLRDRGVLMLDELGDYNTTKLKVFANCDRFVSVQGGNSVLASCFGGQNVIYAVKGKEVKSQVYKYFHNLSWCDVRWVRDYKQLIELA